MNTAEKLQQKVLLMEAKNELKMDRMNAQLQEAQIKAAYFKKLSWPVKALAIIIAPPFLIVGFIINLFKK